MWVEIYDRVRPQWPNWLSSCIRILDILVEKKSAYLLIMVGNVVVVDQTGDNVGDNNFCLISNVGGNTLSKVLHYRVQMRPGALVLV